MHVAKLKLTGHSKFSGDSKLSRRLVNHHAKRVQQSVQPNPNEMSNSTRKGDTLAIKVARPPSLHDWVLYRYAWEKRFDVWHSLRDKTDDDVSYDLHHSHPTSSELVILDDVLRLRRATHSRGLPAFAARFNHPLFAEMSDEIWSRIENHSNHSNPF